MLSIALSTLRTRAGSFVGGFVALFCAAALVAGCGVLLATGLRGQVSPERYAAAPLLVSADQQLHFTKHKHGKTKIKSKPATETVHLPMSRTARVRAVPGVATAIPEVTFPATVVGEHGPHTSWGHGWGSARLTPFTLARGHAPTAPDEVVLDAATHARLGERVRIQTPETTGNYIVAGITAQALSGRHTIFFTDSVAARFAHHRLTAIGVWPAAGAGHDTVTRALEHTGADVTVSSGIAKGAVEFSDVTRARVALVSMSAAIGGTALLVAILVVVGTFVLSTEQRRHEIALLRAVGATPRQVRRMLTREALVLGLVAAGAGAVAGLPVAHWLRGRFVDYGTIPARLHLVTGPLPLVAAAVAVIVAAMLASRIAARRATRMSAAAVLADADTPRRSRAGTALGVALVGVGIAVMVLLRHLHAEPAAMPLTMLAPVVTAAGLMLLGPFVGSLVAFAATMLRPVARRTGPLAADNLRAGTRRGAAVAGPIALGVAMAATMLFAQPTVTAAAQRQVDSGVVAGYALRGPGAGVPADVIAAARHTPGVTAVTPVLHSTIWVGKNRYAAQGVTPTGLSDTLDLGVRKGSVHALGRHTVALSTTMASTLHTTVGRTVALRLGDGTRVRLRVVATYSRGLGFGAVTLPYDLLAAHVDVPMPATVLIAAPASAAPALRALVAAHPGSTLTDHASLAAQGTAGGGAAARYIALGLIVGFAAISMINTLAIATVDRRREFALLRRVGATRRQILRMLRAETLAALAVALLAGGAIGAGTLTGLARGMTGTAAPTVSAGDCLIIVAAAAALTYLGSALPSRILMRTTGLRD